MQRNHSFLFVSPCSVARFSEERDSCEQRQVVSHRQYDALIVCVCVVCV